MSCPYKFIFGVPKKGFHERRFLGLSLNDILGTIGLAIIYSFLFKSSIVKSLIIMFILGEVLHYLFGVQTAFLTLIGIKACQ